MNTFIFLYIFTNYRILMGIISTMTLHQCLNECSNPEKDMQITKLTKENLHMKEQLQMCSKSDETCDDSTNNNLKQEGGKINVTVVVLDQKFEAINKKIEQLDSEFKKNKAEMNRHAEIFKNIADGKSPACDNSCEICEKNIEKLHKENERLMKEIAQLYTKLSQCGSSRSKESIRIDE